MTTIPNLTELKRSLAECHVTSEDTLSKFTREAATPYQVDRAKEELSQIDHADPISAIQRLTLSIQLLNMAKAKMQKELRNPPKLNTPEG